MRRVASPLIKSRSIWSNGRVTIAADQLADFAIRQISSAMSDATQRNQKKGHFFGASNGDFYVPGIGGTVWTNEIVAAHPNQVGMTYVSTSNNNVVNLPDVLGGNIGMSEYVHDSTPGYWRTTIQPATRLTPVAPPPSGGCGGSYSGAPYVPPGGPYGVAGSYNPLAGSWVAPTAPSLGPSSISSVTSSVVGGLNEDTVTWTAVAGAAKYGLFSGSSSNTYNLETFINAPTTSYTFSPGVADGTNSYYRVVAYDAAGHFGPTSTENSYTHGPAPVPPQIDGFGSPPITTTPFTNGIGFSFMAVPYADHYEIRQYATSAGTGSYTIPITNATGAFVVTTGVGSLAADTEYFFRVFAVNRDGVYGPQSAVYDVWTLLPSTTVTPTSPTSGTIDLNWVAVSGATSYTIKRSNDYYYSSPTTIASGVTATTYSDTGLTSGHYYSYSVTPYDSGRAGMRSDIYRLQAS